MKKSSLPTKIFSSTQERLISDALGWSVVSGSGAAPCAPGDVKGDNWLGECKTHVNNAKSIYFNLDVWHKIESEAMFSHRKPVLFTDDGSQSLSTTWCVCRANSVEDIGLQVHPMKISSRKNISFDHLAEIANFKSIRRTSPEAVRGDIFVFSTRWGDEDIYIMPFESFERIVREQG